MLETSSTNGPENNRICHECVEETYLSAEIKSSGVEGTCSYCDDTLPSLTLDEFADRVETAFQQHFVRTPELDYDGERGGVPVVDAIASAAGIPEIAAKGVAAVLEDRHSDFELAKMGEEAEFSSDSFYEEIGVSDGSLQEDWRQFEQSLKGQARFFSQKAAMDLAKIFGGIDQLKTYGTRQVVVTAGPKTRLKHLYRARVFQSDDKLEEALQRPDLQLGSPPAKLARAGRMNAQGISVFYGATRAQVGIAEVRPPVGSRVVVARFDIIRPLRLLDLTALEMVSEQGSIFDHTWVERLERAAFLRSLCMRMVRPVMPDDEALDYLPTQAIADFLAMTNQPKLDGIIFPSAQTKVGRNVVLFHHASKVETLPLPAGVKIKSSLGWETEDGFETEYSVYESVPPPKQPNLGRGVAEDFDDHDTVFHFYDEACHQPTLVVDPYSLEVHHIASVNVKTDKHAVRRRCYQRHD